MNLDISDKRCVLFTRSNTRMSDAEKSERQQIAKLRAFARRRRLEVVGHVSATATCGSSHNSGGAVTTLINKKSIDDFDVLLMTDLSRLSRDGVCHTMHLISRLAAANIGVVTLDFGLVGNGVFNAFHLRQFRKKKGRSPSHGKKNQPGHSAHHQRDDDGRGGPVPVRPEDVDQRVSQSRSRTT